MKKFYVDTDSEAPKGYHFSSNPGSPKKKNTFFAGYSSTPNSPLDKNMMSDDSSASPSTPFDKRSRLSPEYPGSPATPIKLSQEPTIDTIVEEPELSFFAMGQGRDLFDEEQVENGLTP